MNPKNTWTWVIVAAGLFAFIFFFERHWHQPAPGPAPILPNLKATAVTSIVVRPAHIPEIIRTVRTNSAWLMTQPVTFPASQARVEALLAALEQLVPVYVITAGELQRKPKADEEFGFENPQISLELQQGDHSTPPTRLKFGRRTAPGDQMFVQVVGGVDIYVVDAELMKLLPGSANDWRDPALVDLRGLVFDRISITNAGKAIVLHRDATNATWRITEPLPARADARHIRELLQKLQGVTISRFVSDDPRADLDTLGLLPADLTLAFASGTNPVALLQFGKTNADGQFFARREGFNSIFTVPGEPLAPWREQFEKFRERQLLALPAELGEIEVLAAENFVLQRKSSNAWQLAAAKFPVDAAGVNAFLAAFSNLEIVEFVKDAVTKSDLGSYGLTSAVYQIFLKTPAVAGATNATLLHVSFGSTNGANIHAHRADEGSVYAVKLADFQKLPMAGWQLRERRIWNFSENELARVVIHQSGKTRELIRRGTNSWSFAAGSQGIINGLAVEIAARGFGELTATAWVAHGPPALEARYGITTNSLALTFELKRGDKFDLQFGALSPAQYPYARVTLDGEPWVFEFSTALFQLVWNYLTIPETVP
jgi:hypothetical protein